MDTVTADRDVREVIKRVLRDYASVLPAGDVEAETIFDDEKGHYELLFQGWNRWRRIHGCVIHIDLRGDMVWIQHDGTSEGVANDLMDAGIPADRIVLGFRSPDERKNSRFALG